MNFRIYIPPTKKTLINSNKCFSLLLQMLSWMPPWMYPSVLLVHNLWLKNSWKIAHKSIKNPAEICQNPDVENSSFLLICYYGSVLCLFMCQVAQSFSWCSSLQYVENIANMVTKQQCLDFIQTIVCFLQYETVPFIDSFCFLMEQCYPCCPRKKAFYIQLSNVNVYRISE